VATIKRNSTPSAAPGEAWPLSALVNVRSRFLRSVNLERDFYTDAPLDGYVPTPGALAALGRISQGVTQPHARAWSVTGPYGTGKSAFALLLTKTLAPPPVGDPSRREFVSGPLFQTDAEGFWPILVTGGREPLGRALVRGLREAARHLPIPLGTLALPDTNDTLGGREAARLYEETSAALMAHVPGCQGLLVVIDELGKFLEYAALHPEAGDVQALQELAEASVRSARHPVLLVTILHQAFDEYAHRLTGTQQAEWRKVQGRFADLPFGEDSEDAMRLVAGAVARPPHPEADTLLGPMLADHAATCRRLQLQPRTMSGGEFEQALRDAWPLHPIALLALPHVFRRFGQNERSLFGFLASGEAHGFADFLATQVLTAGHVPALRVADVYDWAAGALGASVSGHAQAGRLWSATQDALLRCEARPPVWAALVKTIGLLHALGDAARLAPSREMLHFACDAFTPEEIDTALAQLQSATLITYRHYRKAFRPYEGSDIDIDALLREARAEIAPNVDPVRVAARLSVAPPIVARRHSYETGTLRYFDVRACRVGELEAAALRPDGVDGLLLLCLVPDMPALAFAEDYVRMHLSERPDIVVCLARETNALREAAASVESLLRVQDETEELAQDKVAKREVDERLREASAVFQSEWESLLRQPGNGDTHWLWQGERQGNIALQPLLSWACDTTYPYTPRLRNELINRRQLSSTAASARRELITAMLTRAPDARLGIEGWPPEASMYVSVLEETGLHRDGGFAPPPDITSELGRVWVATEEFLFGGALEPKPLLSLHEMLVRPPFGLTDGLIPVLLCAVLLHHSDEVLVYEENRFVTQLDAATFERMMKRPEDYALQGCKVVGERQAVVERFARGILTSGEEPTLVNVVRALFRNFARLPEYTLKTRRLPADARALRDVFKEARGPEQLLFVDLPTLLDCRPFAADDADEENVSAFFARWNVAMSGVMTAYDGLLSRIEQSLCDAFGVADWADLRARSADIGAHLSEPRLVAFVQRAADETLERRKWLESIGAVVAGRPPLSWSDAEEKRFAPLLQPLAAAFAHSELLAFEKSRTAPTLDNEERVGLRLSVTQGTGEEDASLVILSKENSGEAERLASVIFGLFNVTMENETHETRLAVIGQVMQRIMREKNNA